jgi:multiple sugar transport system permease protein
MTPLNEVSAREVTVLNQKARIASACLVAVLFLLPLVYMVSGSLRQAGLPPPRSPELVPAEPTVASYERAFELVDLARYALNSTVVVALAVPLTLLFSGRGSSGPRRGETPSRERRRTARHGADP